MLKMLLPIAASQHAANLRAKTFWISKCLTQDSSIILISRGAMLMSIGDVQETSSQRILVGIILVGRLGVPIGCPYSLTAHLAIRPLTWHLLALQALTCPAGTYLPAWLPAQPDSPPRVFIKGGCSRRGVQRMGVVLYNDTAYNIM